MHRLQLLLASAALWAAASPGQAGPPPGAGRHVGSHVGHPGPGHRPIHPAYRAVYPGWNAGYWGPRARVYVGGLAYWGGWPYAWGAGYAVPYAVAPQWVAAYPAAQLFAPQEPLASAPAPAPAAADSSFWYYCTQPAGYFPYVQECSHAWMKVVPQLPGAQSTPPRLAP